MPDLKRECSACGAYFEVVWRKYHKYCSEWCQRYGANLRQNERYARKLRVIRPNTRRCNWCNREFVIKSHMGRTPEYCCNNHNKQAWRYRQKMDNMHAVAVEIDGVQRIAWTPRPVRRGRLSDNLEWLDKYEAVRGPAPELDISKLKLRK